MITQFDAQVPGRASCLSGQPVNGELEKVSASFKGLADKLNATPLDDRRKVARRVPGRPRRCHGDRRCNLRPD